jgi:hypothetical protein
METKETNLGGRLRLRSPLTTWRGRLGFAAILTGCLSSETPPPHNTDNATPATDTTSFAREDSVVTPEKDTLVVSGEDSAVAPESQETPPEESAPTGPPQPTVADIAANYAAYLKITDKVIQVNPELAALCRGANEADVAKARLLHGPHAHTGVLIYMNDSAARTFTDGAGPYPVGSVVVKHKTAQRYLKGNQWISDENGVGGMVKRAPGYDPDHGDWEYFYFEDSGDIESGRISSCVECHAAAKDKDHVFGTWKKP